MGMPTVSANSSGAAPVPPSAPSTVMKSGIMRVVRILAQISVNSSALPMQSLKPTGLPPESSRSCSMKRSRPSTSEKALWPGGESTVWPGSMCRMRAISGVFLLAGSTPPWPGLAPWLSFTSIMRTCGRRAFSRNSSGLKFPLASRQPK